jgi:hypothetical protein
MNPFRDNGGGGARSFAQLGNDNPLQVNGGPDALLQRERTRSLDFLTRERTKSMDFLQVCGGVCGAIECNQVWRKGVGCNKVLCKVHSVGAVLVWHVC